MIQYDNATAHRARRVREFLENENVEHLDWPTLSPDMNPIENLWAEVSRRLGNMDNQPTTLQEPGWFLIACWRDIPLEPWQTWSRECHVAYVTLSWQVVDTPNIELCFLEQETYLDMSQ